MTENLVEIEVVPCTSCRFCKRAEIYKVATCLLDGTKLLVVPFGEGFGGVKDTRCGRLSQCPRSWFLYKGKQIGTVDVNRKNGRKRVLWRVPLENLTKVEASVWCREEEPMRYRPRKSTVVYGDCKVDAEMTMDVEDTWAEKTQGEIERERRQRVQKCEEMLHRLNLLRAKAKRSGISMRNTFAMMDLDRWYTAIQEKLNELEDGRTEEVRVPEGERVTVNGKEYKIHPGSYQFEDTSTEDGTAMGVLWSHIKRMYTDSGGL